MARKIAWNQIPQWAKTAIIERGGSTGVTQITRENGSLSISGGVARFNGMEVAPYGVDVSEENQREEIILESSLPVWAQAKMRETTAGDQVQMTNGVDALQIAGGVALFNGKRVIRSPHVIVSEIPAELSKRKRSGTVLKTTAYRFVLGLLTIENVREKLSETDDYSEEELSEMMRYISVLRHAMIRAHNDQ